MKARGSNNPFTSPTFLAQPLLLPLHRVRRAQLAAHLPLSLENPKYFDPHTKANILLQCHFGRVPLGPDHQRDLADVLRPAPRLILVRARLHPTVFSAPDDAAAPTTAHSSLSTTQQPCYAHSEIFLAPLAHLASLPPLPSLPRPQAMVDVLSSSGWLRPTLAAMELCQMVIQGLWNDDSAPLMQLPHMTREAAARFLEAVRPPGEGQMQRYQTHASGSARWETRRR